MRKRMEAFFNEASALSDWVNADVRTGLANKHGVFLKELNEVLMALQGVTGCNHFVDTSKSPEFALALSLLPGVELQVLNLTRDPRAVACSWVKSKGFRAAIRFSRLWAKRQQVLDAWSVGLAENYLQVRYEDFVGKPEVIMRVITDWAGFGWADSMFRTADRVHVSWEKQHLFPPANEGVLKARKTDVQIRPADTWREPRNWHIHLLALLLSYPQGWRYIRSAS